MTAALWIAVLNILLGVLLGFYFNRRIKELETRIHADKWIIEERAASLKDYWSVVTFMLHGFNPKKSTAPQWATFIVENYVINFMTSYQRLRLHYSDFEHIHFDFLSQIIDFYINPHHFGDLDTARDVLSNHKVFQLEKQILELIQSKLDSLDTLSTRRRKRGRNL